MNKLKDILQTILTLLVIAGVSTALYLYTAGFRLQKDPAAGFDITKTGMVNAKSVPESASVYIDGKLTSATNDTVAGLKPGTHTLKIFKKGFVEWKKDIQVFPELVTDITAVLVSQTPRLEPLTNTGARSPFMSQSLTKLAYFSEDPSEPGIYVISFGGINVGVFKSGPNLALEDTKITKYSQGKNIEWSPDETDLLVEGAGDIYYLVDLQNSTSQTTSSPDKVRQTWKEALIKKHETFMTEIQTSEAVKKLGLSDDAIWAPDDKKFLYVEKSQGKNLYKVYNLEKPLPIGEKMENIVLETKVTDKQPILNWYPDSFHFVMLEGTPLTDSRGVVSLIRIDGTNKTEVYNNTIMSDNVFSSRDGDKLIILTSFKSSGQTDLYSIGIR